MTETLLLFDVVACRDHAHPSNPEFEPSVATTVFLNMTPRPNTAKICAYGVLSKDGTFWAVNIKDCPLIYNERRSTPKELKFQTDFASLLGAAPRSDQRFSNTVNWPSDAIKTGRFGLFIKVAKNLAKQIQSKDRSFKWTTIATTAYKIPPVVSKGSLVCDASGSVMWVSDVSGTQFKLSVPAVKYIASPSFTRTVTYNSDRPNDVLVHYSLKNKDDVVPPREPKFKVGQFLYYTTASTKWLAVVKSCIPYNDVTSPNRTTKTFEHQYVVCTVVRNSSGQPQSQERLVSESPLLVDYFTRTLLSATDETALISNFCDIIGVLFLFDSTAAKLIPIQNLSVPLITGLAAKKALVTKFLTFLDTPQIIRLTRDQIRAVTPVDAWPLQVQETFTPAQLDFSRTMKKNPCLLL